MIAIKKKTSVLATAEDFAIDLTIHEVAASLVKEFVQKIVRPYYEGNFNAAVQDLIVKALSEQDFVHSHITHVRNSLQKSS